MVITYTVHTTVRAIVEEALAVGAGLCGERTGEEEEAEAGDGDHVDCGRGTTGVLGASVMERMGRLR